MNKLFKGLMVAGMATVAGLSLASCNGASTDTPMITIGCYMTRGNTYESLKNFLDDIKDDLNFEYETVLISQTDANANLSTFQTKLEAGSKAIITMMDNSAENTQAILNACKDADAYLAGWQVDFNNSRNTPEIVNDDHFLGTATDGDVDGKGLGQYFFDQLKESDNRNIVLTRTPVYAYPTGKQATDEFKRLADEWNAKPENADDQFNIIYANTKEEGSTDYSYDIGFGGALATTELNKWTAAGCDAIVAVNSLANRIYPTLSSENQADKIDLYTVGWDEGILPYFGEDKTIKTEGQSVAETIVYPLIMCLNAIRDCEFTDIPASGDDGMGKFVIGQRIMVDSDADIAAGKENCMIYSTDYSASRALISGEDLVQYLGSSEGASWAKLKGLIDSWDEDYVLYRK